MHLQVSFAPAEKGNVNDDGLGDEYEYDRITCVAFMMMVTLIMVATIAFVLIPLNDDEQAKLQDAARRRRLDKQRRRDWHRWRKLNLLKLNLAKKAVPLLTQPIGGVEDPYLLEIQIELINAACISGKEYVAFFAPPGFAPRTAALIGKTTTLALPIVSALISLTYMVMMKIVMMMMSTVSALRVLCCTFSFLLLSVLLYL